MDRRTDPSDSDIDGACAFLLPYPASTPEHAPQRKYPLRDVLNALLRRSRTGSYGFRPIRDVFGTPPKTQLLSGTRILFPLPLVGMIRTSLFIRNPYHRGPFFHMTFRWRKSCGVRRDGGPSRTAPRTPSTSCGSAALQPRAATARQRILCHHRYAECAPPIPERPYKRAGVPRCVRSAQEAPGIPPSRTGAYFFRIPLVGLIPQMTRNQSESVSIQTTVMSLGSGRNSISGC